MARYDTAELINDARGYAFVALHRAYQEQCGWQWFAANKAYNYAPSQWDWIGQGLAMFDRRAANEEIDTKDQVREIIGDIIAVMRTAIRQDGIGKIGSRRLRDEDGNDAGREHYPKYLTWSELGDAGGFVGFGVPETVAVEDRVMWEQVRDYIWSKLRTPEDRAVLAAADELSTLSPSAIGEYLGWSRQRVWTVVRRLRRFAEECNV